MDDLSFTSKFTLAMQKLDRISKSDYEPKSIKNLVNQLKFEEIQTAKEEKKKEEALIKNEPYVLRKEKVNWLDIRTHQRQVDQYNIQKKAKNEISSFLTKERDKEYLVRMEKEIALNKKKVSNIRLMNVNKKSKPHSQENNFVSDLNLKKKEFSRFINRANIEKLKQNKKSLSPSEQIKIKNNAIKVSGKRQKIKEYSENNIPEVNKKNRFIQNDNRYRIDRRVPLQSKPNYLKSVFASQGNYSTEKVYSSNKKRTKLDSELDKEDGVFDRINKLYYRAEKMENKANNERQLERLKPNILERVESKGKIADYLVGAIQAKLEILKEVNG